MQGLDLGLVAAEDRVAVHLNGEGRIRFDSRSVEGEPPRLIGGEVTAGDEVKEMTDMPPA